MKRIILYLVLTILLSSFSQGSDRIIGAWAWIKSVDAQSENNVATPKSIANTKKLVFTNDGKVITYKNNVEIRVGKYEITKGISVFDHLECDLISFEGISYIIENLDKNTLVIINNSSNAHRSFYKKIKK
jgi:lipopolysaccharide assembly outer membrane protein LptD (OstA)